MDYFSIVLGQIIGFVIYILIGIIGVRMGVLTPRSLGVLSQFITKISLMCTRRNVIFRKR